MEMWNYKLRRTLRESSELNDKKIMLLSESSDNEKFLGARKMKKSKIVDYENGVASTSKDEIFHSSKAERGHIETKLREKENLMKITQEISSIYTHRFCELTSRRTAELFDFKKKFVDSLTAKLVEWENYMSQTRQLEHKLLKTLQNYYSLAELQSKNAQKIVEMHEKFIQNYEELIEKYRSETEDLERIAHTEVMNMIKNYFGDNLTF